MENRIQQFFLILTICFAGSSLALAENNSVQVIEPEVKPRQVEESQIDTEFFELGAFAGLLTIDNFSTEPVVGISAAFHATEDFFVQFNYGMASADLTSYEELSGSNIRLLTDDERDYNYYDLMVGYNIFPVEIFLTRHLIFNSAIYLNAGVGNTEFAGEDNFTVVWGTGYRIILKDWINVHVDFKDHMFRSDVIRNNQLTHNIEFSLGLSVFF